MRRWRCSRARNGRSSCSAAARARRNTGSRASSLRKSSALACVTDLKQGAMFPTDHPAHYCPPFNALGKDARELLCEADVILALDWVDLGGALRQAKSAGAVTAPRSSPARSIRTCIPAPTWNIRRCRRSTWRWPRPAMWSWPSSTMRSAAVARIRGRSKCRPRPRPRTAPRSAWSRSRARCAISSTIRRT